LDFFSQYNLNAGVAAGINTEASSQTLNQNKDTKKITLTHWQRWRQQGT
jgi:hypothetical protein